MISINACIICKSISEQMLCNEIISFYIFIRNTFFADLKKVCYAGGALADRFTLNKKENSEFDSAGTTSETHCTVLKLVCTGPMIEQKSR